MAYVTMKQMLETGVHFGHQTRRWNPKMRPYIFGARNGIHIIDLQQTVKLFQKAHDFIADTASRGGKVLFIGTKRQAQEAIKAEAERCGMFFVTQRWMGGTLTNFATIKKSIERLKSLETMFADGSISKFPKKEIVMMNREVIKLNNSLGGIKDMGGTPDVAFIIDPKREAIAVQELRKLKIPVVAIVDTNCDPDLIDYIVPGNDDAIRAIKLFATHVADACLEGQAMFKEDQAKRKDEPQVEEQKPEPVAAKPDRGGVKVERKPRQKPKTTPKLKVEDPLIAEELAAEDISVETQPEPDLAAPEA